MTLGSIEEDRQDGRVVSDQLANLKARRSALLQELAQVESIISELEGSKRVPVLSYDVLSTVFSVVNPGCEVTVSQVCRLWREAALSLPKLWSVIKGDQPSGRFCYPDAIKTYLTRSQTHLLDIYWDERYHDDDGFQIFLPHVSRCRSLFVNFVGIDEAVQLNDWLIDAPNLRMVSICYAYDRISNSRPDINIPQSLVLQAGQPPFALSPLLKSIHLESFAIPRFLTVLPPAISTIHLQISNPARKLDTVIPPSYVRSLFSIPTLENLSLYGSFVNNWYPHPTSLPEIHSNIRHLRYFGTPNRFEAFTSNVLMSGLRSLSLCGGFRIRGPSTPGYAFPFSTIESLELFNCEQLDLSTGFGPLFDLFPQLRHLTLIGSSLITKFVQCIQHACWRRLSTLSFPSHLDTPTLVDTFFVILSYNPEILENGFPKVFISSTAFEDIKMFGPQFTMDGLWVWRGDGRWPPDSNYGCPNMVEWGCSAAESVFREECLLSPGIRNTRFRMVE
ncbi:hypothetical protein BDN72DRAFT_96930 [Pluteus cervinus]|uniref:Uncharacterized protein n=1 Tax=Pluteus cervinus TaxID=181527 RepID=A0ACD3APJ1_9AGAR|nr:hypothetical protein BDN72DRAFT_96930 [Pluteus cervinus]